MTSTQAAAGSVYALLTDGTTIEIRPAVPDDLLTVEAMHMALSEDSAYLRFFSLSRLAAETEARRVCRELGPGHAARPVPPQTPLTRWASPPRRLQRHGA